MRESTSLSTDPCTSTRMCLHLRTWPISPKRRSCWYQLKMVSWTSIIPQFWWIAKILCLAPMKRVESKRIWCRILLSPVTEITVCRSSYRRSKLPLFMAVLNISFTLSKPDTLFSSFTLPLLVKYAYKIVLFPSHRTLTCQLILFEAFTNLAAIIVDNLSNIGHYSQQAPRFENCPGNKNYGRVTTVDIHCHLWDKTRMFGSSSVTTHQSQRAESLGNPGKIRW